MSNTNSSQRTQVTHVSQGFANLQVAGFRVEIVQLGLEACNVQRRFTEAVQ